jgi:hypothetical protein
VFWLKKHVSLSRIWRVLLALVLLVVFMPTQPMSADDTAEVLDPVEVLTGHYGVAVWGVGLHDPGSGETSPGDIALNVPGTAVVRAYLVWSGFDTLDGGGDNTVSLAVDGGAATAVTADAEYGGATHYWYGNYYRYAYYADVTSLVLTGNHTYTISDFGPMYFRDGAGLQVVYEDPDLPVARVDIRRGLDRFYRGWGEGARGETAVNCYDFEPVSADRQFDFILFVSGIEATTEPRPTALWYDTGTDADPQPSDMVNAPTDGPVTGTLIQGPTVANAFGPFYSNNNPEWDTYVSTDRGTSINVPAGNTWVCLQVESATFQGYNPASGMWLSSISILPTEDPTAVELLYFRVRGATGRELRLEWATAVEVDNFGFNLYRAPVPDCSQAGLVGFVPAQGYGGGATYTYADAVPAGGLWWYWLADVDTCGKETFHGPASAQVGATAWSYRVYLPITIR